MVAEDKVWGMILDNVKTLRTENAEAHEAIQGLLKAQNGRIRTLENWRFYLMGVAFGAAALMGVLVKYLPMLKGAV